MREIMKEKYKHDLLIQNIFKLIMLALKAVTLFLVQLFIGHIKSM